MATSTDNSTVLVSDSVIPSASELAGTGDYSADSVTTLDPLTSGGSSPSIDTYSPSTSAPTDGSLAPISGSTDVSSNPISGGASGSSNPFGGGSQGAGSNPFGGGSQGAGSNPFGGGSQGAGSNPFGGGSQSAGGFGGGSQGAGGLGSSGLGVGTTNTFAGAANNPYAGGGGESFGSLGNVVVGNNQWIIGKEITPERFSKAINFTVEETVDSVIGKLSNRLSENGIVTSSGGGNPFAGGNNPFGTTNAPALDYLKQAYGTNFPIPESASNFTTAVYTQTLPGGSSNPFPSTGTTGGGTTGGGGSNPFASGGTTGGGGSNPFASGGITGAGGSNPGASSGNPLVSGGATPSLDIVSVLFGDNLSSSSSTGGSAPRSSSETLRVVQDSLLNFTKTVNSATGKRLFSGNSTPLQSPSDLLTLYKNDIVSANTGINNVNELAGGSGDPYSNLLAGSGSQGGSQAVQPPTDILSTVLGGLLPFSGSDNIFNTPEGGIPVGYGNKDFGGDNAVIGNANWNYGQSNASIGNANWNWDSSKNNATIGNGNWHLDNTQNNRTIGNGNWYWESTSNNKTLGNGNWSFGNNNTTIGNGNWDYGSNNTIIGNGNQVFTSNSVVIGNGNWSVVIDKSNTAAGDFLGKLDNLVLSIGIKDAADNLVNSLFGKFADAFQPLTSDFSESTRKTYDQFYWDSTTVG